MINSNVDRSADTLMQQFKDSVNPLNTKFDRICKVITDNEGNQQLQIRKLELHILALEQGI